MDERPGKARIVQPNLVLVAYYTASLKLVHRPFTPSGWERIELVLQLLGPTQNSKGESKHCK